MSSFFDKKKKTNTMSSCMDRTLRDIRTSAEYLNTPRSTRYNNKTKSRCNKTELCALLALPPIGGGNAHPDCTWSIRQLKQSTPYRNIPRGTIVSSSTGRTKSRARKLDLCTYIEQLHLYNHSSNNNSQNIVSSNNNSQNIVSSNNNSQNIASSNNNSQNIASIEPNIIPSIVTIRLNADHDPNGALGAIQEIGDHFAEHCPEYTQRSYTMNSRTQLINNILDDIPDNTVAQLVIITHGDRTLIQTGSDYIDINNVNHFNSLITGLRRILMPNATIMLVACRTGNISGEMIGYDRTLTSYQFVNWPDVNIASKIANELPGIAVFATPRVQRQDELQLYINQPAIYNTMCDSSRPRPIYSGVVSSYQPVYKFIRTLSDNEQLIPTIEIGN